MVTASRSAAPGSRRSRTLFMAAGRSMPRGRAPTLASLRASRPDVEVAAALAPGLPRVGGELEAGGLERPVVDAAGDLAEARDLRIRQPGLAPGVLQRAALELDIEPARVATGHLRREHPSLVRHPADKRLAKTGEVGRRIAREPPADLRPPRVDRPPHHLRRARFPMLGPQHLEEMPIHHRSILERREIGR